MKKEKVGNIETIRHSLSHVLAMAVLSEFPKAKLAIGPSIDNGFYYDFDLPRTLTPEDLPILDRKMKEIIKSGIEFKKTDEQAKKAQANEKKQGSIYKAELIADLIKGGAKKVSYYTSGDFSDLCAGPHIKTTRELLGVGFALDKIAGAYWRGDEKNKMLQRIYGLAFETKAELVEYKKNLAEAEKRDHRRLGASMDLFSFHEAGPGFPFWHPKGMILRENLLKFWREEHEKAGYEEVSTPMILREDLWHQSGHWDNYKESMYFTEIDNQKYAVKPMNCPGGTLIYKNTLHSYREFPLRVAELGLVHRHELSGVLHGLLRVRSFIQDDAHIYCTEDQVEQEIKGVIKLIQGMYRTLGFRDYHLELSTRPKKSIGSDAMWKQAEGILKKIDKDLGLKAKVNPGDGAFYGPKFDFHIKDSIGRTWQCGTIQLDFSMPERFNLEYIDKTGAKKHPIMIHRTVFGSLERFIAVLLESTYGVLPVWLSPVQVNVITVGAGAEKYAKEIQKKLIEAGFRSQLKDENETVGKKIREAEIQKVPFMLVVGDKEMKTKSVAVRTLSSRDIKSVKFDKFIVDIKKVIEERK
jgi:threonyl-tRNA synthetase